MNDFPSSAFRAPHSALPPNDLLSIWDALGHPRILVLGDIILDRYTWGDVERISPEAPVPILKVETQEVRLGGAASVAALLRGLDADVVLAGVIGNDVNGRVVRRLLAESGLDATLVLTDPGRPTTTKQRLMGRAEGKHPHHVLRVDEECTEAISRDLQQTLTNGIRDRLDEFDAIVISDYAKGVCRSGAVTSEIRQDRGQDSPIERPFAENAIEREIGTMSSVIRMAKERGIPVLVDPARLAGYECYQGATLLKPNRVEARLATDFEIDTPQAAMSAADLLRQQLELDAVVITLDRDGMVVSRREPPGEHWPAENRVVCDITGAGDTAISILALVWAGLPERSAPGGNLLSASARLANIASGLQVQRFGVAPISRAEIRRELVETLRSGKVVTLDELAIAVDAHRRNGKTVVFTNGCFDLLHVGHLTCLQRAATFGDVLIVAVNSDRSVRDLKGPDRPVIHQTDRAALLAGLECVDHVVIFDQPTPHELLWRIRPDVLVKGQTTQEIIGREVVEAYGGKVCVAGFVPGVSTTTLIQKTREFASAR